MRKEAAISRADQFDPELVTVDVPEKTDGRYVSVIGYNSGPLYLQTPRLKVVEVGENNSITVSVPEGAFRDLVAATEARLISTVAERSVEFFRRKTPFSVAHVSERHKPTISSDGTLALTLDRSVVVRNQYGAEKAVEDVRPGTEISVWAHASGLLFGRTSSEILVSALQIKVHMDPRPTEWQMEETVIEPDPREEISEELIKGAEPLPDDGAYFDDL